MQRKHLGNRLNLHICYLVLLPLVIFITIIGKTWYESIPQNYPGAEVVSEYDPVLAQSFDENPVYEIGLNQFGIRVFKDPQAAYDQILIDCKDAIEAVHRQFDVGKIQKWNWEMYGVYGWQLDGQRDSCVVKQGLMLSGFFDIYENSFMTDPL